MGTEIETLTAMSTFPQRQFPQDTFDTAAQTSITQNQLLTTELNEKFIPQVNAVDEEIDSYEYEEPYTQGMAEAEVAITKGNEAVESAANAAASETLAASKEAEALASKNGASASAEESAILKGNMEDILDIAAESTALIATTEHIGIVKPNGSDITVENNGTISVNYRTAPYISLEQETLSIKEGLSKTVPFFVTANSLLTASSSDSSKVTTTISGSNVVVTGVASGTATVTVIVEETATTRKSSYCFTVNVLNDLLEDYTWEEIREIGSKGIGANCFDIGDSKTIVLNGTIGTLSLSDMSLKVYIIDFNYRGDNGVYFQGFKTTGNIDIALVDGSYNTSNRTGSKIFNLNHWGSSTSPYNRNYGGWKGCDLRYDILGSTSRSPSGYGSSASTSRVGYDATTATKTSPVANTLMAALPSDLRDVLALWTIYTDNKGNSSNIVDNVTTSTDYLPLLSEFEVFGVRTHANQFEQNYQAQMKFYKNGNSKIKYRSSSTSSTGIWRTRSPYYNNDYSFATVNTSGTSSAYNSYISYGLAPAFRVA